jgi:hypothetical protein
MQIASLPRRIHCHLWPVSFYHIVPHYLITLTLFWKKLLNTKCVLWFSLQLLPERLLIIRRIQRNIIINIHAYLCKVPIILGAWGSVVVKALRCESEGLGIDPQCCRWGFFPKLPTQPCTLGSIQPLKMSTRKTPGGEGGRWVRVTTSPPS